VVANLLSLGAHVTLAGVVGKDDSGRRLRSLLRRQGVDVSGVLFDPGRPTTLKTRIVAHAQQVVRADYEKKHPLSPTMEAAVLEWLMLALPQFQAVFLSDYLKGFFTPTLVASIAAACASRAIPLVVGPSPPTSPSFAGQPAHAQCPRGRRGQRGGHLHPDRSRGRRRNFAVCDRPGS